MGERLIKNELIWKIASNMLRSRYGQSAARKDYLAVKGGSELTYDEGLYNSLVTSMEGLNANIISAEEREYPETLKELRDHPFLLFYRGDLKYLNSSSITFVGTRRSSIYGGALVDHSLSLIESVNRSTENQIGVISGMAYGIDRKAHLMSLKYNIPTIAVVAGGLDTGYPKINDELVQMVSDRGLIISEFPPSTQIIKGMFPMRNRIMAALGKATVVVEAPVNSGALLTANQALELGREVYAFPGDYFKENSKGTNGLIRDGASPLTSKFDILDMINRVAKQRYT